MGLDEGEQKTQQDKRPAGEEKHEKNAQAPFQQRTARVSLFSFQALFATTLGQGSGGTGGHTLTTKFGRWGWRRPRDHAHWAVMAVDVRARLYPTKPPEARTSGGLRIKPECVDGQKFGSLTPIPKPQPPTC